MVHVHGRRNDGTPTQDRETFRAILEKTRAKSDVLVQFSTGGAVGMSVAERIEGLDLLPDMATLTTGTVNFGDDVFLNSWPMVCEIAERLTALSIRPEIEVFDTGMVDAALRLVREERITGPLHFDFVLGVAGGMGARPENLEFLVSMLPDDATWCVAGMGRHELPLAFHAVDLGGHVRVGLEDNIYLSKGVLAPGSFALVEKVVEYATSKGRDIATPDQARELLHITSNN
jgi:3-keto-5-aminohexanoate cleavage enzyme